MKNKVGKVLLTICLTSLPILPAFSHEKKAPTETSPHAAISFEVQFLDTMIKHHEDGIEMFQMAVNKAQNPDVKTMAEKMVKDQKKEIPELQNLKNEVESGESKATNMNMPGMAPMDMSKLKKASGTQFDREFLSMTINHHKGAIKMADVALEKAKNADVRAKAQMIHDKQKDEVARMEKMLMETH